jgi:hypothetical protein
LILLISSKAVLTFSSKTATRRSSLDSTIIRVIKPSNIGHALRKSSAISGNE